MVNINLIHKRETKYKKLTQKKPKNWKENKKLVECLNWRFDEIEKATSNVLRQGTSARRQLSVVHKAGMNTSKDQIKRHFHALQIGLGLISCICITKE